MKSLVFNEIITGSEYLTKHEIVSVVSHQRHAYSLLSIQIIINVYRLADNM